MCKNMTDSKAVEEMLEKFGCVLARFSIVSMVVGRIVGRLNIGDAGPLCATHTRGSATSCLMIYFARISCVIDRCEHLFVATWQLPKLSGSTLHGHEAPHVPSLKSACLAGIRLVLRSRKISTPP